MMTESSATDQWIDNHCHLGEDADQAISAAKLAGVVKFVDVGCDLASSTACVERAGEYDSVYATVGLHPHEAKHGLGGLEALLTAPNVIAVGECGLDYHYDHSPRKEQREMFAAQIALAHKYELPLVIHTREAWEETFDVLDTEGVPNHTIFHCFTGGPAEATAGLDRGAWLSFSGIVSFKSATDVQAAAKQCPANKLLIETDSPYLAPVPHRGKANQPAWVSLVGETIASLRSEPVSDIAATTWRNTHRAYPRLNDS